MKPWPVQGPVEIWCHLLAVFCYSLNINEDDSGSLSGGPCYLLLSVKPRVLEGSPPRPPSSEQAPRLWRRKGLCAPDATPAGACWCLLFGANLMAGAGRFLSSLALVPVLGKPCAVHLEGGVFSAFLPSPLVRKDGESSARVSFLHPSPQQRGFASLQKYKILTIERSSSATVEGRLCFLWEKSMDFMPLLQQLLLQDPFSWSYSFSYAPSTDLY